MGNKNVMGVARRLESGVKRISASVSCLGQRGFVLVMHTFGVILFSLSLLLFSLLCRILIAFAQGELYQARFRVLRSPSVRRLQYPEGSAATQRAGQGRVQVQTVPSYTCEEDRVADQLRYT